MRYHEIRIEVPSAHREPITGLLWEHELTFQECDQGTLDPPPPGRVRFQLYLTDEQAADVPELLTAVHELLPPGTAAIEQRPRDDAEWIDAWKRYFTTRRIGRDGRIAIVPSWESAGHTPAPGEITLHLDPGRAFGTGGHASTRLCLQLLGELDEQPAAKAALVGLTAGGDRELIADVGCGCGVLALAALKLFPRCRAAAIDIDPEAIEVTIENAEINGVTDRLRSETTPLGELDSGYLLVFGNLTGPTLHELAQALVARLAPGGLLILSGILTEESQGVADRFTALGLTLLRDEKEEEWTGLLMQLPPR